jgi:hypothetical protein
VVHWTETQTLGKGMMFRIRTGAYVRNIYGAILGLAVALISVGPVKAETTNHASLSQSISIRDRFDNLVNARIEFYNQQFPEIQFVNLFGGDFWRMDMQFIPILLGKTATSLDYEHPKELREDLMTVSLGRLAIMLRETMPSASLYRTGEGALARKNNVCIMTINTDVFAKSDRDATLTMIDISQEQFRKLHPSRYLNATQHLEFTVDHEVYHCLDAYFNGPVLQTHDPFAGEYASYRSENGADAFGVAMNIRQHGHLTDYAKNIMHMRALSLYNDDPNHFTWNSILRVFELNPDTLAQGAVLSIFIAATDIRDTLVPNYNEYLRYRTSAPRATFELGMIPDEHEIKHPEMDKETTQNLVQNSSFWYDMLFVSTPLSKKMLTTMSF